MKTILVCAAALCGYVASAEPQREIQWGVTFGFYATNGYFGSVEANALLKGSKGTPRKGWEEFYRV